MTFSPGDDGTGAQQPRVPGAGIPAPVVQDELHRTVEDGHGHHRSVRGPHPETVTPGGTAAAGSGRADALPAEADGVPALATAGIEDELHAAVSHTPAMADAAAHTTCLYPGTCPSMRGDSDGTVKFRRAHPVLMLYQTKPVMLPGVSGPLQCVAARRSARAPAPGAPSGLSPPPGG